VALCAFVLVIGGCTDRLLHDVACADGRVSSGELCFADAERSAIDIPFTPLSVRVDDFDGDDHRDLLVLGVDPAGIVVGALVAGDGNGGFAPPIDAGVHGCSAYPVPGRFDDDGPVDLLVDECDSSMLGFFGSASGVFGGPMRIEVGAITRTSAIVDVDADAIADVIVLGDPGDGSSVLVTVHGLAGGGFASPVALPASRAIGFSIGDVDDDGAVDALLSVDGGNESPMIARGRAGELGFAAPEPFTAIAPAGGAALRDIDDDGVPEVIARPPTAAELTVYERDAGEYRLAETTDLAGHEDALLETGRLDGDDHLDLATYDAGGRTIELWLGDDLQWQPTAEIELDANVSQLVMADIDEDGAADLVAGTFEAGTVTIVRATP
jgi:hypothetical protein